MSSATGRFRPEKLKRRVNPDSKTVVSMRVHPPRRPTGNSEPAWNRGKGTFARQDEAERGIDEASTGAENHHGAATPLTVGDYVATWTQRHPRSERTNVTKTAASRQMLDVELDGRRLRDWHFRELRRRHALALVATCSPPGARHTGAPQRAACAVGDDRGRDHRRGRRHQLGARA